MIGRVLSRLRWQLRLDRRWANGRYPNPAEFDAMTAAEFEAYLHERGYDAEIDAALAEIARERPS